MYCSNVPLLSSAAGYRSLGRHLPSVVEVRRRVFDVHLKRWGNGQRTGLVIEGQMFSLFGEKGCLEAMMGMSSIMIGFPGGDVQDFIRELGVEAAAKRHTAWILFSQTLYPTILNQRFAAGSPSEVFFVRILRLPVCG